ncbi:hypothetical protein PQX77_015816 [Marasmius sp. AFHP31]|nr:hypothetical protein PQX77_015816 [Marasmius sp. AFHP31]
MPSAFVYENIIWEPESSFSEFADWSVDLFWERLGLEDVRERIEDYEVGTQFAVPAETLENKNRRFKLSKVTRKTKYPRLIVRGPELPEGHPDARNGADDSGQETGSTTEVEEELNDIEAIYDDEDELQRRGRRGDTSRSNLQKGSKLSKRAAAELYPESTQPYLTVPGSLLHTKAKLYQNSRYTLVQPGDPERTFKEFSMNTRPDAQRGEGNPLLNDYSREEDLNTSLLDLNDGGKEGTREEVSRPRLEPPMMMKSVRTDKEVDYQPMDVDDAAEDADDEADAEADEDMNLGEAREANLIEQQTTEVLVDTENSAQNPEQEAHDAFNSYVQYPEDDSPMDTSDSGSMVQEDTDSRNPLEAVGLNTDDVSIGPQFQYFPFNHPDGHGDDSFEDLGPLRYPETEQPESGDEVSADEESFSPSAD